MFSECGANVAEAFQKYSKTRDERLIERYTAKELRTAANLLSQHYDRNKMWFREIERRHDQLVSRDSERRYQLGIWLEGLKEKWLAKVVAFALGLTVGLIF